MYEVRLTLSKQGRIRYVSHLDMFRLMQRAVRRADIPLWYTEGFNPHPYISFLLALSLGIEGLKEPVDIRIVGDMTCEEIKDRLNAVMPEGMRVEEAYLPFNKPAEISWGEYEVVLDETSVTAEELNAALVSGGLTCEKSGKSGGRKVIKTVNVSEHIKRFAIVPENGLTLRVTLPAGSVFNLNPIQLMQSVEGYLGKSIPVLRAVRTGLLCEDMSTFR